MSKVLWLSLLWCASCLEVITSELKEDTPALRCPPNVNTSQCLYRGHKLDDEYLFTIQGKDKTVTYSGKDFKLSCPKGTSLEDGILPSFTHPTIVSSLTLSGCTPTTAMLSTLAALNVSLPSITDLVLRDLPELPAEAPLLCPSLNLTSLELCSKRGKPTFNADILQGCTSLLALRLMGVDIDSTSLNLLPVSLKQLALRGNSLEELPAAALQRLTKLERLEIQSDKLRAAPLDAAINLRAVVIYARLDKLTIPAMLENVTLGGGCAAVPKGTCNVKSLRLVRAPENVTTEWLRRCGTLKAVTWYCIPRGTIGQIQLPPTSLQELRIHQCRLNVTDATWLRDASALSTLEVVDGAMTTLPRELFVWNGGLRSLSMRNNGMTRDSVRAVATAKLLQLRELDLSENPLLGDLCSGGESVDLNAVSLLVRLRALEVLKLFGTGATHLCPDWRRDLPALKTVDLRNNNISRLQGDDLHWSQRGVSVEFCGNPLETVSYSREQYRASLVDQPRVNLHMCNDGSSMSLRCDCDVYWFARSLLERPDHVPPALTLLSCEDGTLLRDMSVEHLTCPVPSPPCPVSCNCSATGEAVFVNCNRAGLNTTPSINLPVRTLDLSHNALTRLDAVPLPANLTLLDISHNHLANLSDIVLALNASQRLRMTGNSLLCDCASKESLAAVMASAARIQDWASVRCSDGALIAAVQPGALCSRPVLTALLATLLVAATLAMLTIALFLTSRRARKRIKWFLWWRWRGEDFDTEEMDAKEARYEAFVSFATNEAGRAATLAARLESQGRRLCLHHRDWAPGELITEQIARSVRDSRRTIVLLSDAFLASTWARAEFRAAWALTQREKTPRLLLVLLPELTVPRAKLAAMLPADLAVAVATCTYLEWDEPRFWERLERAVPLPPVTSVPVKTDPNDVERY